MKTTITIVISTYAGNGLKQQRFSILKQKGKSDTTHEVQDDQRRQEIHNPNLLKEKDEKAPVCLWTVAFMWNSGMVGIQQSSSACYCATVATAAAVGQGHSDQCQHSNIPGLELKFSKMRIKQTVDCGYFEEC